MRYGIWTPLPHTVQPEPALDAGAAQLATHGRAGEPDLSLKFAADVLRRAEDHGFDLTLIAQRWLGSTPLRANGARSYSIYVWHWPVLVLGRRWLGNGPWAAALLLVTALVLAELA